MRNEATVSLILPGSLGSITAGTWAWPRREAGGRGRGVGSNPLCGPQALTADLLMYQRPDPLNSNYMQREK